MPTVGVILIVWLFLVVAVVSATINSAPRAKVKSGLLAGGRVIAAW